MELWSLKNTNETISKCNDEDLKQLLEQGYNLFNSNLTIVLNILGNGGNYNE